uniref:Uncharacterized protein n=1 Tax=Glossina pallidipes TaxID=7398 RepID=A0A1A9Z375_GLOPL
MLGDKSAEKDVWNVCVRASNDHSGILTSNSLIPMKFRHASRNVLINNIFMVLAHEFPYRKHRFKIHAFDYKHHPKHETTDVVNYLLHLLMHSCMALKTGMRLHVSNSE